MKVYLKLTLKCKIIDIKKIIRNTLFTYHGNLNLTQRKQTDIRDFVQPPVLPGAPASPGVELSISSWLPGHHPGGSGGKHSH